MRVFNAFIKEQKLAEEVMATGKKVVVIIMGGRPYALGELGEKADALLYAFYPGLWGGQAIAEVLFGDVNPSGRLPISVPRNSGQLPVYYNYKNSYQGMGYSDETNGAAYAFGDGKGYSQFAYEKISLSHEQLTRKQLKEFGVSIDLTIKNTSKRDGYAVPLLYMEGLQGSVVRRVKELRNVEKVWLRSGETKTITMHLPYEAFSIWDSKMQFLTEAGKVKLLLEEMGETIWTKTIEIQP